MWRNGSARITLEVPSHAYNHRARSLIARNIVSTHWHGLEFVAGFPLRIVLTGIT